MHLVTRAIMRSTVAPTRFESHILEITVNQPGTNTAYITKDICHCVDFNSAKDLHSPTSIAAFTQHKMERIIC